MTDHNPDADRLTVRVNDRRIEVYNHVTVLQRHSVRPGDHETTTQFYAGDWLGGEPPDAVTTRLAEWLYDEFDIEVEAFGTRIIDLGDEEVDLL